ncbi:thioredoxin fold domain-containing protein [Plectonema cf. radiosum LEGE 06105]|uniref:Thioredoxin fold domain-containing protein n=1 Tax=Plectonema cf. radiosum LEGE 06105 TaxID=945769 RepID=A0A8J7F239_9CYAN|nr:thioredoxin domain-containing protein [Plectonema radiosum]MBE9214693.1 thioredoxin fold domain-containing protein [Plectonema cf. radiosum LEGE 06105]
MSELANSIFSQGRDSLEQLQQESPHPILVKFVAPHCPSCKTLTPILEQLVNEHSSEIHMVTIDMAEEPELAMELGVRSAPTVFFLQGKKVVVQIPGLKPKKLYAEAVEKILRA